MNTINAWSRWLKLSSPAQENLERGLHRFGTFLAVRQFGERVFRWAKELHKTRTGNISLATIFSDLKATYWMVGVALIGACIFSFVWILLMRYLAGEYFLLSSCKFSWQKFQGRWCTLPSWPSSWVSDPCWAIALSTSITFGNQLTLRRTKTSSRSLVCQKLSLNRNFDLW